MDSTQSVTFRKIIVIGIVAAFICVIIVGGVFVYLNKKTAEGIERNIILDDINSRNAAEDYGPREGGVFTRMGIINQPPIEEDVKPSVATSAPAVVPVVKATTTPVVKPKPKPKPKPVIEEDSTTEINEEEVVIDDSEVTVDDEIIEEDEEGVIDNPGI